MLKIYVFFLTLCQILHKIETFEENTEFDVHVETLVNTKNGGDPSFLTKFVNDKGIPQGLKGENYINPSFCSNIDDQVLTDEKYSNCTILQSKNGSVLKLNFWTNFDTFKFGVNLLELKNVTLELVYQTELTYLYFTAFRKCEDCLFNFTKNPSLVGLRFWNLAHDPNLENVPAKHRPKLYIRGNSRLSFTTFTGDRRKLLELKKACNPEMCVIQNDEECHFRYPIKGSNEYQYCRHVYGDMHFTGTFRENNPAEMKFVIEGCFIFNRTKAQYVRGLLKSFPKCSRQHIFEHNQYMCTDQLDQIKERWGHEKVKIISDGINVKCYQGECRGGFVSEAVKDRYSGCETFQGDVYLSETSGNLSERIKELSYAHTINGQLLIANNPSITKLSFPFLKKIKSTKCPALQISNMTNLEFLLFQSHVEFSCRRSGPIVMITNSSKLYLHHQMLRQLRKVKAVLRHFDSKSDTYSEKTTYYLIGGCFVIAIFMEFIWFFRKNLLLPNFLYRLFPMRINRKPKQKHGKKKKED